MFNLAKCYEEGIAGDKDFAKAVKWYQRAVIENYKSAMTRIGVLYERGVPGLNKNFDSAMFWYLRASELEDSSAMQYIGLLYENGHEVNRDYNVAMKWYLIAAKKNNYDAMNSIGYLFENGLGVQKDDYRALQWYKKASYGGNAAALNNIGIFYLQGRAGLKKDLRKGIEFLSRSAELGYTIAMYNVANFYLNDSNTLNKEIVWDWLLVAADKSDINATNLFMELENQRRNTPEHREIILYLLKKAENGNQYAMNYVSICYFTGNYFAKNQAQGMKWLKEAALAGNAVAMKNIGVVKYSEGDFLAAMNWFLKSYYAGEISSAILIGKMYEDGVGVERNNTQATKWYVNNIKAGDITGSRYLGRMILEQNVPGYTKEDGIKFLKDAASHNDQIAQKILNAYND